MAPPANDNFASATVLTDAGVNFQDLISVTDATLESGEPTTISAISITRSVWYRYTPSSAGLVTFSTFGSNFNTSIAAYTGSSLASLTPVARNNFWLGNRAALRLDVTSGTTYQIQVAAQAPGGASPFLTFTFCRMPSSQPRGVITTPSSGETLFVPTDLSGSFTVAGYCLIDDVYPSGYPSMTGQFGQRIVATPSSGSSLMPSMPYFCSGFRVQVWRQDAVFAENLALPSGSFVGSWPASGTAPWRTYAFSYSIPFNTLPWDYDVSTFDPLPFSATLGVFPMAATISGPQWNTFGVSTFSQQWFIGDMYTLWQPVNFAVGVPVAVPARLATIVG